mmetsp:Transcript_25363/g.72376  ORF Transcript_25363/g.72376 Transcript_25363/m.72376 type:complete len:235 (+) Transcript_25363:1781-2485(+)
MISINASGCFSMACPKGVCFSSPPRVVACIRKAPMSCAFGITCWMSCMSRSACVANGCRALPLPPTDASAKTLSESKWVGGSSWSPSMSPKSREMAVIRPVPARPPVELGKAPEKLSKALAAKEIHKASSPFQSWPPLFGSMTFPMGMALPKASVPVLACKGVAPGTAGSLRPPPSSSPRLAPSEVIAASCRLARVACGFTLESALDLWSTASQFRIKVMVKGWFSPRRRSATW